MKANNSTKNKSKMKSIQILIIFFFLILLSNGVVAQGPTNADKRNIFGNFFTAELYTDDNEPCGIGLYKRDRTNCANNAADDYYVKLTVDGSQYFSGYFFGNAPGNQKTKYPSYFATN